MVSLSLANVSARQQIARDAFSRDSREFWSAFTSIIGLISIMIDIQHNMAFY